MSEIERAIERTEEAIRANQSSDGWLYDEKYAKTVLSALRAELDREKNPLTWNERINQMDARQKAAWFLVGINKFHKIAYDYAWKNRKTGKFSAYYIARMEELLNGPYTEGATK